MSYACALLGVSQKTYDAVKKQIKAAESPGNSYDHMFNDKGTKEWIDMTHIGLIVDPDIKDDEGAS